MQRGCVYGLLRGSVGGAYGQSEDTCSSEYPGLSCKRVQKQVGASSYQEINGTFVNTTESVLVFYEKYDRIGLISRAKTVNWDF
jgi:hypothetical protein